MDELAYLNSLPDRRMGQGGIPDPLLRNLRMQAPVTNNKRGRGGTLTSLISEGGAAGGAAIGTALLPGVGTVVGAGLGGLFGRMAENKVRDDRVGLGDALKEGAMSGAFSAVAPAFKAVKGARAASKAGGSLDEAMKAARAGFTAAPRSAAGNGVIDGQAARLTKGSSGLKVGSSVGDINELDEIVKVFQKRKIVGSPETQLRKIDTTMSELGKKVQMKLANKPVPVNSGVAKKIQQMIDDPTALTDINLSDKGRQFLQTYINQSAKFKDASELNGLVIKLNPIARRAYNKSLAGTALTGKEEAALAFKQAADDVIQEIAPSVRNLKKEMALLFKYNPQVAKFSEQGLNIPFAGKITKGIAQPIRNAQSRVGAALSGVNDFVSNPIISNTGKIGASIAGRGLVNQLTSSSLDASLEAGASNSSPMNPMTQSTAVNPSMTTTMPASSSNMGLPYQNTGDMSSNPVDNSPFAPDNIESSIGAILEQGGSMKDVSEFMGIAKALNDLRAKSEPSKKPLTQGQQERADLIKALDMAEGAVNDGSIKYGPVGSRVESLKGIFNRADAETLDYRTRVMGLRAAITKARAGTSMTDGERKLLDQYTPSATDSEQVVRAKLAALRQLYGSTPPQGGSTYFEEALMQYAQ